MKAFDKTFTKYGVEAYPYYHKDDVYGRIIVKSLPSDDRDENTVFRIIFKVEHCSVHITDIPLIGCENKGYGSVAMRTLIKHSINKGYLGITGLLSYRDKDHISRLISFYAKNSFDIKLNSKKDSGYIQLGLTNPSELLRKLTERITLLEHKLEEQQQKEKNLQAKIESLEHNIANESKFVKFLKTYF
ncbi:hypothetical protein COJ70_24175 [Priestia megaterium]|uniref:hypothetical protein n=1 Tax=Priestia megaterium TaxID=1404 RepID=UPI000BFA7BC8|nr:hypothetical protein [Priestia megaterium]PFO12751.1 hypothetical protein COJ70_24175 [Priestia megaterium]